MRTPFSSATDWIPMDLSNNALEGLAIHPYFIHSYMETESNSHGHTAHLDYIKDRGLYRF